VLAIDVNTCFGTRPNEETDFGLETLQRLMERYGIAGALTLSLHGVLDDHTAGNAATLAACRVDPRLIPIATISPLRDLGLDEDIAQIQAGGFRAVRLYPGEGFQGMSPDSLSYRRLLERLAPLGLPIIAPGGDNAIVAPLARLTAEFGLPLPTTTPRRRSAKPRAATPTSTSTPRSWRRQTRSTPWPARSASTASSSARACRTTHPGQA
jgi:hypothetical protein